jgi:hypothetical protein
MSDAAHNAQRRTNTDTRPLAPNTLELVDFQDIDFGILSLVFGTYVTDPETGEIDYDQYVPAVFPVGDDPETDPDRLAGIGAAVGPEAELTPLSITGQNANRTLTEISFDPLAIVNLGPTCKVLIPQGKWTTESGLPSPAVIIHVKINS